MPFKTFYAAYCLALITICCAALEAAAQDAPRKRLLLIGQQPDGGHPASTHEYAPGMSVLQKSLRNVAGLEVSMVQADGDWAEGPDMIAKHDAVVAFVAEGAKWVQADPRRHQAFVQLAERGGGLSVLHWGMGTKSAEWVPGFQRLFGGCHGGPDRKYKVLETELAPANPPHPIAAGMAKINVKEEFYYGLKFQPMAKHLLPVLVASIDGNAETVAWAWERPDGGRSFGFSGLHYHGNWKHAEYRQLVARAALWTLKWPAVEKFVPAELDAADFELSAPK